MDNVNEVVYMVIYKDDRNQKHMAFVQGYSSVKFLKDRFGEIYFERTEKFERTLIK